MNERNYSSCSKVNNGQANIISGGVEQSVPSTNARASTNSSNHRRTNNNNSSQFFVNGVEYSDNNNYTYNSNNNFSYQFSSNNNGRRVNISNSNNSEVIEMFNDIFGNNMGGFFSGDTSNFFNRNSGYNQENHGMQADNNVYEEDQDDNEEDEEAIERKYYECRNEVMRKMRRMKYSTYLQSEHRAKQE